MFDRETMLQGGWTDVNGCIVELLVAASDDSLNILWLINNLPVEEVTDILG